MRFCIRCGAELSESSENLSMTYHKILRYIKVFLALTAVTTFYMTFSNDFTIYRSIDQIFYLLEFILISLSFFYHNKKSGVIYFFLWGYAELGLYFVILLVAYNQGSVIASMIDQIVSYTIGSMFFLIPTYLYYKKRYNLLS
ncbi:hypothetical protein SDC9_88900 [bioreactor metagenome]|uniref:Uncharacterized protein n=1 Tax=bioreactor metagenome TaxID=1076179 RepID=A0A644ZMV0_9ZZZZ